MSQDKTHLINQALDHVKVNGLTEEQIATLFQSETQISTREALLVSHVQFLETKLFAALSILEEIAALENNAAGSLARTALESLTPGRAIEK